MLGAGARLVGDKATATREKIRSVKRERENATIFLTEAQFGDVCERRRWRMKRAKRSGSNLPIGEELLRRRQRLSYNRESA